MRIAYITAGAAGMYCGSCMRDNTLVAALNHLGHDATLVPTYTPIRTDEENVSLDRVFYGGINVYLEQKTWLFRHTPRFVDWLFNRPALLRWATKSVANADYGELAELTISTLKGEHGRQRKEVQTLVEWLKDELRPDVVVLSNVLQSGMIPAIKAALHIPVLATLQGDDLFLDALPKDARMKCVELIRDNDRHIDGLIATSRYYADHMASYLGIERTKVHVVYPGINLAGHAGITSLERPGPPTIGFFARICPEKGFHNIVDSYIRLRRTPGSPAAKFRASGWLGESHRPFFEEQLEKLRAAGLADDFEYVDSPTLSDKVRFLQSLDVFSVPTDYREPKGLYILEAWANGVPVVQPRHGAFPELIEATGGGLLVDPGDPDALASGLREMLDDEARRKELGCRAALAVRDRFTAETMAERTLAVLNDYVRPGTPARNPNPGTRE